MEHQESTQSTAYFTFRVSDTCYGVDAMIIQEVVLLPEVTPLEEAPPYIIGAINLRGKTVSVMNLNARLGREPDHCRITDSLVVLEQDDLTFAIVVNKIEEIVNLTEDMIDPSPSYGDWGSDKSRIIGGIGRTDNGMIMVLDKTQFFCSHPVELAPPETESVEKPESSPIVSIDHLFFEEATEAEKKQFHERSERLKKPLEDQSYQGLIQIAVIEIAGERLGVELNSVQGFSQLSQLTPIPCCPSYILGIMNLRGDNLTIIDIRAILNLSVEHESPMETVMVMRIDEKFLGVSIHQVIDVIHIRSDEISKVPVAIGSLERDHLKGLAPYEGKMLIIADLENLFRDGGLVVDEEV